MYKSNRFNKNRRRGSNNTHRNDNPHNNNHNNHQNDDHYNDRRNSRNGSRQNKYNDRRNSRNGSYHHNKHRPRRDYGNRRSGSRGHPNSRINQLPVKRQLINYIYESLNVAKFKFKILEFENDLSLIEEEDYMVSANYNGKNCFAVFKKFNERYYSFIVDRRTLSYNQRQLDYERIEVTPINIRLDESVYKGTIFDGVLMYANNKHRGKRTFVINDVYMLRGKNISNDKILYKMINIDKYLESCYQEDEKMNSLEFVVNRLYELGHIKSLVNSFIPNSKHTNFIKGIAFFPDTSGTKLIYLYNNCAKDILEKNDGVVDNSPSSEGIITVRDSGVDVEDEKVVVFRMKNTDTPDVYELSLAKIFTKNGKKLVRYKKVGLAYIPTRECSFFCRDIFKATNKSHVMVECKYIQDKDRWVPVKKSPRKKPDNFDSVYTSG